MIRETVEGKVTRNSEGGGTFRGKREAAKCLGKSRCGAEKRK